MASKRLVVAVFLSFIAFSLGLQPLISVSLGQFDRVLAQTTNDDWASPEDAYIDNNPIDSLAELGAIFKKKSTLKISPQDINAIRDNRVDTRVISYLTHLVTPIELGGAGLDYIKVQRILKNYDTRGTGRIDRETLAATEEGTGIVSAHNTGQAVDISVVGSITCKLVERRHLGGSKTKWQSPKPIKVAWQSRDGIRNNPTPKGPSFFELAGNMSAQSILLMLNQSGEMDDFSDFVKGLSLEDIFKYVGVNVLLKNYGVGAISVDPRSLDLSNILGALLLQQHIPDLPNGLALAEGDKDLSSAVAVAYIEDLLNLPGGSLRGSGWNEVLASSGKRTLENALGLPALTLETKTIGEILENDSVKASLDMFTRNDDSFGVLKGTIDLLKKKDQRAYVWAGVNVVANALRLSTAQHQKLIDAVKSAQTPRIDLDATGTDSKIPTTVLEEIFGETVGETALKSLGQTFLQQALKKVKPNSSIGLTQKVINDMTHSASSIIYEELQKLLGQKKIASDASLSEKETENLQSDTKKNDSTYLKIAQSLNDNFDLTEDGQLSAKDAEGLTKGKGHNAIALIGGSQTDKAIGWNNGTGYKFITGKVSLGEALEEVFGNVLGEIAGLPARSGVSLKGDIYNNYGIELVKTRLNIDVSRGVGTSSDILQADLYRAFGLTTSRPLDSIRNDSSFWFGKKVSNALDYTDIRLGATLGTSEEYLRGNINNKEFSRRVAQNTLKRLGEDQLIDYLDLDEALKLEKDEVSLLFNTIASWDNATFEDKNKVINLGKKMMGRSLDQRAFFSKDTFLALASGNKTIISRALITEGIKQFAGSLGVQIEGFDNEDIEELKNLFIDSYNSGDDFLKEGRLTKLIAKATKIPEEYEEDLHSFINGNLRIGLESWSAAMMVEFASKYLPETQTLTYEEMRGAIDFTDTDAILARAELLAFESGESDGSSNPENFLGEARRDLMQELRDNAKYKISDAFLVQAEIPIPENFTKTMFSGTTKERAALLTTSLYLYLDQEIAKIDPFYEKGTLERIFNGDATLIESTDLIIRNLIDGKDISIGPFSLSFLSDFYSFTKAGADNRGAFYTSERYSSMWSYMEDWFSNTLGIDGLPSGFGKSLYLAYENGWDLNSRITDGEITIVSSVHDIGRDLIAERITKWADKVMNIPAGSTYQIFRAISSIDKARKAVTLAKAGGGALSIADAKSGLSVAEAELTVLVINIALNACDACQQFFASIDKAIAAPPGFTNALVAGAIAMAFGLGPAGLIIAAAIYLFGVYKVDYLCPLPPTNKFAYAQFDNDYDQLEPDKSKYYDDPLREVKDNPAPGENKFDWSDGVPFVDGNSPELWMAWSRYFTGKLLDATMSYGATQDGVGKPLQIITYRQANVEFFLDRSVDTFGQGENNNDFLGLGFTQNSTKTTDWVHTAFGGYF